ncbi:MAG: FHA domain-containing protein, partial [Candidatus Omnitrophota bacterium]
LTAAKWGGYALGAAYIFSLGTWTQRTWMRTFTSGQILVNVVRSFFSKKQPPAPVKTKAAKTTPVTSEAGGTHETRTERKEMRSEPLLRDIIAAIETLNDSAGGFLDPYLEGARAELARLIAQAKKAGYGDSERLGRAYDRKLALIKRHAAERLVEEINQISTQPGFLTSRRDRIRGAERKLQKIAGLAGEAELTDELLRDVRLAYQLKRNTINRIKHSLEPKKTRIDRVLDSLARVTRTYPGRTKLVATAVVLTVGKVAWDLTAGENALSPETLRMILTAAKWGGVALGAAYIFSLGTWTQRTWMRTLTSGQILVNVVRSFFAKKQTPAPVKTKAAKTTSPASEPAGVKEIRAERKEMRGVSFSDFEELPSYAKQAMEVLQSIGVGAASNVVSVGSGTPVSLRDNSGKPGEEKVPWEELSLFRGADVTVFEPFEIMNNQWKELSNPWNLTFPGKLTVEPATASQFENNKLGDGIADLVVLNGVLSDPIIPEEVRRSIAFESIRVLKPGLNLLVGWATYRGYGSIRAAMEARERARMERLLKTLRDSGAVLEEVAHGTEQGEEGRHWIIYRVDKSKVILPARGERPSGSASPPFNAWVDLLKSLRSEMRTERHDLQYVEEMAAPLAMPDAALTGLKEILGRFPEPLSKANVRLLIWLATDPPLHGAMSARHVLWAIRDLAGTPGLETVLRHVLFGRKIDEALQLGFFSEILFAWQMKQRGYKVLGFDQKVEGRAGSGVEVDILLEDEITHETLLAESKYYLAQRDPHGWSRHLPGWWFNPRIWLEKEIGRKNIQYEGALEVFRRVPDAWLDVRDNLGLSGTSLATTPVSFRVIVSDTILKAIDAGDTERAQGTLDSLFQDLPQSASGEIMTLPVEGPRLEALTATTPEFSNLFFTVSKDKLALLTLSRNERVQQIREVKKQEAPRPKREKTLIDKRLSVNRFLRDMLKAYGGFAVELDENNEVPKSPEFGSALENLEKILQQNGGSLPQARMWLSRLNPSGSISGAAYEWGKFLIGKWLKESPLPVIANAEKPEFPGDDAEHFEGWRQIFVDWAAAQVPSNSGLKLEFAGWQERQAALKRSEMRTQSVLPRYATFPGRYQKTPGKRRTSPWDRPGLHTTASTVKPTIKHYKIRRMASQPSELLLPADQYFLDGATISARSLELRDILRRIGPEAETLARRILHAPDVQIALIPLGSTLKGYAGKNSDLDYTFILLSGISREISYDEQQAIYAGINRMIEAKGARSEPALEKLEDGPPPVLNLPMVKKRIGSWLSSDDGMTAYHQKDDERMLAIYYLFLPAVYGDWQMIEKERTGVIRELAKKKYVTLYWRIFRSVYDYAALIYSREKKPLPESVLRLGPKRGLPDFKEMAESYFVAAGRSEIREGEPGALPQLEERRFLGDRNSTVYLNAQEFSKLLTAANLKAIEEQVSQNRSRTDNLRAIRIELPEPVEIDGRLWTHVYAKGVVFDARKPFVPHQGMGFVPDPAAVSETGDLVHPGAHASPDGGMFYDYAKNEFENTHGVYHSEHLRANGVFSSAPLGYGRFEGLEFPYGDGMKSLGFVLLATDQDMPEARLPGTTIEEVTTSIPVLARTLRLLHDEGFTHPALYAGNVSQSADRSKTYVHDLPQSERIEVPIGSIEGLTPRLFTGDARRTFALRIRDLLYLYRKYLGPMLNQDWEHEADEERRENVIFENVLGVIACQQLIEAYFEGSSGRVVGTLMPEIFENGREIIYYNRGPFVEFFQKLTEEFYDAQRPMVPYSELTSGNDSRPDPMGQRRLIDALSYVFHSKLGRPSRRAEMRAEGENQPGTRFVEGQVQVEYGGKWYRISPQGKIYDADTQVISLEEFGQEMLADENIQNALELAAQKRAQMEDLVIDFGKEVDAHLGLKIQKPNMFDTWVASHAESIIADVGEVRKQVEEAWRVFHEAFPLPEEAAEFHLEVTEQAQIEVTPHTMGAPGQEAFLIDQTATREIFEVFQCYLNGLLGRKQGDLPEFIANIGFFKNRQEHAAAIIGDIMSSRSTIAGNVREFFLADDGAMLRKYVNSDFFADFRLAMVHHVFEEHSAPGVMMAGYFNTLYQLAKADKVIPAIEACRVLRERRPFFDLFVGRYREFDRPKSEYVKEPLPISRMIPAYAQMRVSEASDFDAFTREVGERAETGEYLFYPQSLEVRSSGRDAQGAERPYRQYVLFGYKGKTYLVYRSISHSQLAGPEQAGEWKRLEAAMVYGIGRPSWFVKTLNETGANLHSIFAARIKALTDGKVPGMKLNVARYDDHAELDRWLIGLGLAVNEKGQFLEHDGTELVKGPETMWGARFKTTGRELYLKRYAVPWWFDRAREQFDNPAPNRRAPFAAPPQIVRKGALTLAAADREVPGGLEIHEYSNGNVEIIGTNGAMGIRHQIENDHVYTFGRYTNNHYIFYNILVSRRHGELKKTVVDGKIKVFIRDVGTFSDNPGSRNGTYVRGTDGFFRDIRPRGAGGNVLRQISDWVEVPLIDEPAERMEMRGGGGKGVLWLPSSHSLSDREMKAAVELVRSHAGDGETLRASALGEIHKMAQKYGIDAWTFLVYTLAYSVTSSSPVQPAPWMISFERWMNDVTASLREVSGDDFDLERASTALIESLLKTAGGADLSWAAAYENLAGQIFGNLRIAEELFMGMVDYQTAVEHFVREDKGRNIDADFVARFAAFMAELAWKIRKMTGVPRDHLRRYGMAGYLSYRLKHTNLLPPETASELAARFSRDKRELEKEIRKSRSEMRALEPEAYLLPVDDFRGEPDAYMIENTGSLLDLLETEIRDGRAPGVDISVIEEARRLLAQPGQTPKTALERIPKASFILRDVRFGRLFDDVEKADDFIRAARKRGDMTVRTRLIHFSLQGYFSDPSAFSEGMEAALDRVFGAFGRGTNAILLR